MLQTVDMDDDAPPPRPLHHLREWREFRGFTQDSLAAEIGTNGSVIHLLENGSRRLSDKWLRKLAKPLRTMPGAILDYDPNKVPTAILEAWDSVPDDLKEQAMRVLKTFHRKSA
jgi:transcriptional regulator with XRE-family HTH domain